MESFITGEIMGIEQRTLPANTYNLMRTLFHQSGRSCLFVPIRSMQYQAIIDEKEVSFVYAHRRTHIEFVWRKFKPQQRESLDDAVDYEFIYYDERAPETMKRAQIEFHKFCQQLYERNVHSKRLKRSQKVAPFRSSESDKS